MNKLRKKWLTNALSAAATIMVVLAVLFIGSKGGSRKGVTGRQRRAEATMKRNIIATVMVVMPGL